MHIEEIRALAQREEIDYNTLKSILASYANPRMKISHLLQSGDLVRVKKGLYIFGSRVQREPFSIETLANLIYGPSAISLEYALSYYGMIPERVETITSITPSRNKLFKTPVGIFSYTYLHRKKYPEGLDLVMLNGTHPVLMATREKALADTLVLSKASPTFKDTQSLRMHLHESMRIEDSVIASLDLKKLEQIDAVYCHLNTHILIEVIASLKRSFHA